MTKPMAKGMNHLRDGVRASAMARRAAGRTRGAA